MIGDEGHGLALINGNDEEVLVLAVVILVFRRINYIFLCARECFSLLIGLPCTCGSLFALSDEGGVGKDIEDFGFEIRDIYPTIRPRIGKI